MTSRDLVSASISLRQGDSTANSPSRVDLYWRAPNVGRGFQTASGSDNPGLAWRIVMIRFDGPIGIGFISPMVLGMHEMLRILIASTIVSFLLCTMVIGDAASGEPLKPGDAIGAFYVTKVAGAEDDGVEPGDSLCYRCRYGSSPMVMIFARRTGGKLTRLVKELDLAVVENQEFKLRGLLTLMGDDVAVLKGVGKEIVSAAGAKMVPVVIADDVQTGPLNYRLRSDVEVTIVVAKDSQVVATYVAAESQIDLSAVMLDLKQILN